MFAFNYERLVDTKLMGKHIKLGKHGFSNDTDCLISRNWNSNFGIDKVSQVSYWYFSISNGIPSNILRKKKTQCDLFKVQLYWRNNIFFTRE